jgi:HAMP domain-containing protein
MRLERFGLRAWIDLRARIWLVMVFVLLPALAYIVVTSLQERSRARSQAQADLLGLARSAARAQQQSLDEMQRALALVAMLAPVRDAVVAGNPDACTARLAEITSLYPQTVGFGVWNLKGEAVCAGKQLSGPDNAAQQLWFRQVLDTHAFSIGDFALDGTSNEPAITFGYPVTGTSGALVAVISSGLDLKQLTSAASGLPLPPDSLVSVFDHNGIVLARSQDAAAWIGKSLPEAPGLETSLANGAGIVERVGSDGVRRVYAFTPVMGPGGKLVYLSIGRPSLTIYEPADTALATSLAISGGLALLALALAGWWSRQTLVRPMQGLLSATDRLAHGDLTARARPEPAGSEVDRLATAFNVMAANVEQRETERKTAELNLREAAERATRQAQLSQARAAQLEAVNAGLSRTLTPADVIHVILHQGAGAVGASAATLLLLSQDSDWLKQAASVGYPDQFSRLFQQFPVSSPLPAADVVRTGEAVWIESAAMYRARYPQLTEVINSFDYEGAAVLPLRFSGRLIGVLSFSFPGILSFTNEIQSYVFTLAGCCAQALERARLVEENERLKSALG